MYSNKNKLIISFSLIILYFFSVKFTTAQKTSVLFSKSLLNKTPKMIEIELSDSNGTVNINNEAFNSTTKIYFKVKPQRGQDWTLSKKDAEKKVSELKLIQSGKIISSSVPSLELENEIVKSVIISYPKSEINIINEFKFKLDESESNTVTIPEWLWPNYSKYNTIITNSESALNKNLNYFNAFKILSKVWCKDTLFQKFSFYKKSSYNIIFYADSTLLQTDEQFSKIYNSFTSTYSETTLNQLSILKDSINDILNYVGSVLDSIKNDVDASVIFTKISSQKANYSEKVTKAKQDFRKKKLSIFEDKNYDDYQFKLYIETLAQLITSVDKVKQISDFDTINFDRIRRYQNLYKEIIDMGWTIDFQSVCRLLNENISKNEYVFNATIMDNLQKNQNMEPQPYYTLFTAYNEFVKKNKTGFTDILKQCVNSITDKNLLSNIDLYIAMVSNELTNNEDFWTLLQKGYNSQIAGNLQDAKTLYEKAEKLSNTSEILFFLMAETNLKAGERYSAENYFNKAISLNPKFILPKLNQIDFLIEDKDFETSMNLLNDALVNNPIWYFYFKKSMLLCLTNKLLEAKTVLINNCIKLNPLNYNQYLLLGDIYIAQADYKSARESYMKAGSIKPNDNEYKLRMESLKQNKDQKK